MDRELNRIIEKSTKIIYIGANYHSYVETNHLQKPSRPVMFFKPISSIILNNQKIIKPLRSEQVEFEAELGVIISKTCKDISIQDASKFIYGFTCINDVTARDLQKDNSQWDESKAFDTFCPIGPIIKPEINLSNCKISCLVNGIVKQNDNICNMIFPVPTLISFLSSIMTLSPGDIISTGTPAGSGKLLAGDIVEIKIDDIGTLKNEFSF